RRGQHERDAVALLVPLEPRRDERPQLVEPERCGDDGAGEEAHLEPDEGATEDVGDQQAAGGVAAAVAQMRRQVAVGRPDELTQAVLVPPEADRGGHEQREEGLGDAVAQLREMRDQAHRRLGVAWWPPTPTRPPSG